MSDNVIFIDKNDSRRVGFSPKATFFSIEYPATTDLRHRMLAVQGIVRGFETIVAKLAEYHLPHEQATELMEVLWHEVEQTVRPYVGASVATKQSARDSAAPTSAPSADSSETQASSSSTKRKATRST